MAFLVEKIVLKKDKTFVCPVCKRMSTHISKLKSPYKCATEKMCTDCFNICYKNTQKNRIAGTIDDTLNIKTQKCNADILEDTGEMDCKEPIEGFEYVYPSMTIYDILSECKSWIFLFIIIEIVFHIYVMTMYDPNETLFSLSAVTPIFMVMVVSGAAFLWNLMRFVKGVHRGISKKRRKYLIISAAVYLALACLALLI